jgi:hypothetical protein
MAHFAELDENNIVLRVTVVANEVLLDENGVEQEALGLQHLTHLGGRWVQTSYNGSFRKNYAGIGCVYSAEHDAFIGLKSNCHDEETLNEDTYLWECSNSEHFLQA